MEQPRKLEKVTRSGLLRVLADAERVREQLEQTRYNEASSQWRNGFRKAVENIMHERRLDYSLKVFQKKWKDATGNIVYGASSDRPQHGFPVYQDAIELVGEPPEMPYSYVGNGKYIFPGVRIEAEEISRFILTTEDLSVNDALAKIEQFRTGG